MTLLNLLGLLFQVVGFIVLCGLGDRLSERLARRSKWATLAVAAALLVSVTVLCIAVGQTLPFVSQTAAFFCVGLAGGLIIRQYDRLGR